MSFLLLPVGLLPDFGGGEMMLILLVVLLLFGGDKMPQLAKGIGKSLREFKKAANEVEQEIKRAIDEVPDTPSIQETIRNALQDKSKPVAPAATITPATPVDPLPTPATPSPDTGADAELPPPPPP
jgi:sec-independent protein translocase protein TatA